MNLPIISALSADRPDAVVLIHRNFTSDGLTMPACKADFDGSGIFTVGPNGATAPILLSPPDYPGAVQISLNLNDTVNGGLYSFAASWINGQAAGIISLGESHSGSTLDYTVKSSAGFTSTASTITSGTTLTIGTLTSGTISIGMTISGTGVTPGTIITANQSGTGNGSKWTVSPSQSVSSTAIDSTQTSLIVTNNKSSNTLTVTYFAKESYSPGGVYYL